MDRPSWPRAPCSRWSRSRRRCFPPGAPRRSLRRRRCGCSERHKPLVLGLSAAGATAAALLEKDGRQEAAETMVATSAVAALADHALKAPFRRRRPPESWFTRGSDASFPSGHSMAACAVPTVLAYTLARERLLPTPAAIAVASVPPFAV